MLILLLCIDLFSGCGSQRKKEIKVMWWGDVYNAAFGQKLIDAYNATNPEVPAKLITTQGGDYVQKLLTMAAANTMPDVALMITRDVHNMGMRGALMDLRKWTSGSDFQKTRKAMWPDIMNAVTADNKVYAVPIWTWTPGIYYNKDLFDKAGVPYPSNDWTWQDFADTAIRLTKKENGRKVQFGVVYDLNPTSNMVMSYIYSHGGRIYSRDMKKSGMNDPVTLAAYKALADLKLKKGVAPTEIETAGLQTGGMLADPFQAGKVAMRISGRDAIDVLTQGGISFRWGVAPMPRGPKGTFCFTMLSNLAISAMTKYPEEAWKFVSFVVSSEGQRLITAERSDVTVIKAMTEDDVFVSYKGRPAVNLVFREMLKDAVPLPFVPGSNEWEKYAGDCFQLVEIGQLAVEEACRQIARNYDKNVGAKVK